MQVLSVVFPWRLWFTTAVLALLFFGFTLTSAVPVWSDDSMIVEYGRVTLAGRQPVFGFYQRSDSGRPLYIYTPLGVILSEMAFRITAPSILGPRVTALAGQLAAFGFFLYYLRLRGVSEWFSVLLGLALLLDPLCDISWRGGRVDGWAFAFLFACLGAIRKTLDRPRMDRAAWFSVFLSGALAAGGLLCWPSFVMFVPLIVLELGALTLKQTAPWIPVGLFATGAAIAAALIITPLRREFWYGLADARLITSLESRFNRSLGIGHQLRALVLSFAQTPFVVAAGLCVLGRKRNVALFAGFLMALVLTFSTLVYRLRVLYLLPYLYIAVASLFFQDGGRPVALPWRRIGNWALAWMLIGGFSFTVVGTTLSGASDRSGKNPVALVELARSAVGSGSVRVFLNDPDLYFAGRTLGWQQFGCFDGCTGPGLFAPESLRLLSHIDVVIFKREPEQSVRGVLNQLGFRFSTVMLPTGGHRSSLFGWSYGPETYGPYFVYKRIRSEPKPAKLS